MNFKSFYRFMLQKLFTRCVIIFTAAHFTSAHAHNYYASIFGGLSHINSKTFNNANATALDFDKGFVSGAAIGRNINTVWSAEIAWSYTSNTHNGVANGTFAGMDGNYASNLFYLTNYYNFNPIHKFKPFLGLSMVIAQEIDLDFENASTEISYSSGGEIGYALTAGSQYSVSDKYSLFGNIVYNNLGKMNLTSENSSDRIRDIKYNPLHITIGLKYNF